MLNYPHFQDQGDVLPMSGFEGEVHWYALYTRSRQEKSVAAQLERKQIHSFLPLVSVPHQWSDRIKVIEQPLFPGYVLVRIGDSIASRLSILNTSGVVNFVGAQGRGIPIPEKQIENVRAVLESRVPFSACQRLRVGRPVRIRGGCLDGVEGILVAQDSDRSVIVSIDLIQRSLQVRVQGFSLEPVD